MITFQTRNHEGTHRVIRSKNIPKKWANGAYLIKESQLEAPYGIRPKPFERFLFAEASWRDGLLKVNYLTKYYLKDFIPQYASIHVNRKRDRRYIVYYKRDELEAIAIVPKSVYKACPVELRIKEYKEFLS